MPLPRFRIRTLMIAVLMAGLWIAGLEFRARFETEHGNPRPYRTAGVAVLGGILFFGVMQLVKRFDRAKRPPTDPSELN